MPNKTWEPPAVHTNYGQMWQTILTATNRVGGPDVNHARTVHVRWKSLGKKAARGRL